MIGRIFFTIAATIVLSVVLLSIGWLITFIYLPIDSITYQNGNPISTETAAGVRIVIGIAMLGFWNGIFKVFDFIGFCWKCTLPEKKS